MIIRDLRARARLTQQEFAEVAGTSQSTVAAYESGTKSPTLRTVERIASKFKQHPCITLTTPLTREDRRSLTYHRAIVKLLEQNSEQVLHQAKTNIKKWLKRRPDAKDLLVRWGKWLELPVQDLVTLMMNPDVVYRDMRQVSPFAGLLSAKQRTELLKRFQREDAA